MEKIRGIDLAEIGHKKVITGVVLGDSEESYLLMFPSEEIDPRIHSEVKLNTEEWEKMLHQMDTLEVEVTQGEHLPKVILRKSQRNIEQDVSWEVFRRDEFRCRYCGNDKVPMTVDHVVTWESMGPSIVKNLVCSCKKCNRIRGNMSYEDWLQTDYYKKVSNNIQDRVKTLNMLLLEEIKSIPLRVHKRNR